MIFLFTDIEGSTRLWEEHPEVMAASLTRHDRILNDAVNEWRGSVLKTMGDGMVAVFDSVVDSSQAALSAQRSLAEEDWGAIGRLRVRMGLHRGDAQQRDGDFYGPVMNRTARIMAAAHGGEILVSGAAAMMLQPELPEGASLRDLGSHRLKDLTLHEHLYQLLGDGVEADFPPPITLDSRPHNLPVQGTEFLGRSDELSAIGVMLASPTIRLLTLAGPGGAGKTRLALQVAAEQMDRFADGVFFVDLAAERDPDAAFETVVRTLDLPTSAGADPLQTLKSRLRDREMLLILDNFEQIISAGPGVAEILQQAPQLKVIVTSRETLRVRAEHVFPIPPLGLPHPESGLEAIAESEAAQLFVNRAIAANPTFALDEGNAGVIAEICLRLDGLPLAIELAAARLSVFPPLELLERLRERLDVLGAGGRDLPDRQRTLWGAMAWSYELLDDNERRLLEMLSVFSGTRVGQIETVAFRVLPDIDVVDTLESLIDKSLVRSIEEAGARRFSMLLMIKEYAATRLRENLEFEASVRRSHALCYSEFAHGLEKRLLGPNREAALQDLGSEIGNLRTAWRNWVEEEDLAQLFGLIDALWALHDARGWYHSAIELATDTLALLARAEATPELASEELTIRIGLARALMAVKGYDLEVEEAFQRALEMSEVSGSPRQKAQILRALSSYYMNLADMENAGTTARELLDLALAEGDTGIEVDGRFWFGMTTAFTGDPLGGIADVDRAIALYDPRSYDTGRLRTGPSVGVSARVGSGLVLWQTGDLGEAVARVDDALRLARELDHPYSVAYALYHNGFLALNRSRFEECQEYALELNRLSAEHHYNLWNALSVVLEGVADAALGRTEEGLAKTETAIEIYQGLMAPPVFWPLILSLRAMVNALAGNLDLAVRLIEEAIEGGTLDTYPTFGVMRGDFLLGLGDPERAESSYTEAIEASGRAGMRQAELVARTHLVSMYRAQGRSPDGTNELVDLYRTFEGGLDEADLAGARAVIETAG